MCLKQSFFHVNVYLYFQRTDCKAVVSVLPGEVMGPEGFQLMVTLSEVHTPRMWVEKHPDKDSQVSPVFTFISDSNFQTFNMSLSLLLEGLYVGFLSKL